MPLTCHICGAPLASHTLRSTCTRDLEAAPAAPSNPLAVRRAKTRALYERGYAVAFIARTLHVSHGTVERDLNTVRRLQETKRVRGVDGGLYPTHQLTTLARKQRQEAALKLMAEGHSIRQVASMLGWTLPTIRADLKAAGVPLPGRVVAKDGRIMPGRPLTHGELLERRIYARALRARGWSIAKIAAELGVSYGTARRDTAGTVGPPTPAHGLKQTQS